MPTLRVRPLPPLRRRAAPLALLALALGCSSTKEDREASPSTQDALSPDSELPILSIDPKTARDVRSIGLYLANIDRTIRAWQEKTWTAATRSDRQKQEQLEIYLENETRRRKAELVEQLESGPDQNRIVAATALGFTRDHDVRSPLLAALEDKHPLVVRNALVGLSLLQDARTPLDRVGELMEDEDADLRGSAAYCARCLVEIGADGRILLRQARGGLIDENPIVRTQCALLLSMLIEPAGSGSNSLQREQIGAISLLLDDQVPLVRSAAARALVHAGLRLPELKGSCARALTSSASFEDKSRRTLILRHLTLLGERNYGEDLEAWRQWAQRLP